jgi:hypothetical protein
VEERIERRMAGGGLLFRHAGIVHGLG